MDRDDDGSKAPGAEVGILLYPDCQLGSVHGLTELFATASRFARHHARGRFGATGRCRHHANASQDLGNS